VFFLEPLKPIFPAEAHEMTCPELFVSVMMMLLKEACMYALPTGSTLTILFFAALVDLAISLQNYY
jgi:hypothetical protein